MQLWDTEWCPHYCHKTDVPFALLGLPGMTSAYHCHDRSIGVWSSPMSSAADHT